MNDMIDVAIVEDDKIAAEELQAYLMRYQVKFGKKIRVNHYIDAESFLSNYNNIHEIVFMDIEMPGLSGLEAAARLREFDKQIIIIFVTNMAQFANKGYEVDALDFIVKPLNYADFCLKFQKAINIIRANINKEITIMLANGLYRIASNKLLYVEIRGHKLIYHLGEDKIESRGTLSVAEKGLKPFGFLRCNNCFLINPRHIEYVKGHIIKVGDIELKISRPKHKAFILSLAKWYTGGGE